MNITCYGEVLWDVFPDHKKIGGAPLNVALRLANMKVNTSVITRVGNDTSGKDIIMYCDKHGVSTQGFQTDFVHKTGEVIVVLDKENTATYQISKPVAWDFIEYNEIAQEEVQQADAFIFGSLASRTETSRKTLFQLLETAKFKILDINLRPPYYEEKLLSELMSKADFIKLNEEEFEKICTQKNVVSHSFQQRIKELAVITNTKHICITRGSKGATLLHNNLFYENLGYKVTVLDTVGAGDSFLATLVLRLLQGVEPQTSLDNACAMGAMVAGSKGANPIFSEKEIVDFIKSQT